MPFIYFRSQIYGFDLKVKQVIIGWLLLVFGYAANAIVVQPKDPYEGIKPYIDSLQNVYLNSDAELKIQAAFALWSVYHHQDLYNHAAIPLLNQVDSAELTTYINAHLATAQNPTLQDEWSLLRLRKRLDQQPDYRPTLVVDQLSPALRAAYFIVAAGELSLFDINGFRHLNNFRNCYRIAKGQKSLAAFEFLCLRNFGMAQFQKGNIDSSVYFFDKIIPVCKRINDWSFKYIPGYGVFYREKQTQGRMLMNLGMSIEKQGNIRRAIAAYEKGEHQFDSCEYYPGIWWGKSQIMNSYLDLGEFERAESLLSELVASITGYFGKIRIDDEFLWTGLHEFDFFDLYETRYHVDSVLTRIEAEGGAVPFRRRLKTRDPLEYSYQQRYTTVRLALRYMIDGKPIGTEVFSVIDSLKSNYLKDPLIEYATKNYIYNSMEFNEAAWRVALDTENDGALVTELFRFVENSDSIYNYNGHFKTILILLHALGKYEVEEQLIKTYLPRIEQGNNVVAQRKLYYQFADVLKQQGKFEKALLYFQKSDSIKQRLKTLNHLEQLSGLDKRLENERTKREKAVLEMENESLRSRRIRQNMVIGGLVVILMLIIGLVGVNRRRVVAKRKRLEAEKELLGKELKSESEKVRLASIEILKNNQSFAQLIDDVENLKTDLSAENRKKVLGLLIDHKTKTQDDVWQEFNLQFQSHYQGFYKILTKRFPDLTENEQRLCAMHISDLTNKEINAITGQKLSSIHTMKSKLRKKLGVENDEQLAEVLNTIV